MRNGAEPFDMVSVRERALAPYLDLDNGLFKCAPVLLKIHLRRRLGLVQQGIKSETDRQRDEAKRETARGKQGRSGSGR